MVICNRVLYATVIMSEGHNNGIWIIDNPSDIDNPLYNKTDAVF